MFYNPVVIEAGLHSPGDYLVMDGFHSRRPYVSHHEAELLSPVVDIIVWRHIHQKRPDVTHEKSQAPLRSWELRVDLRHQSLCDVTSDEGIHS